MGNGNSVAKQKKDRRNELESTDGSSAPKTKRASNNDRIAGSGVPDGLGETKNPLGKLPRATNPFIIFFLRLRSKKPKEPVTVIARAAGKLWAKMSIDERKKYIDLANAEKRRREERKRKRKIIRQNTRSTHCVLAICSEYFSTFMQKINRDEE